HPLPLPLPRHDPLPISSTFNALNDALPAMLERGRGEGGDFPAYFSNRCLKFAQFLSAANEEVAALLCRRQYQSRVRENRAAVCRDRKSTRLNSSHVSIS